jgi:hypothetical protein
LSLQTLRYTVVTRLAEAEATIAQIATITGHSQHTVQTILERYLVRIGTIVGAAFKKRLALEGEF